MCVRSPQSPDGFLKDRPCLVALYIARIGATRRYEPASAPRPVAVRNLRDLCRLAWAYQALATFGPHAIGTERSLAVSNGASFAQVTAAIQGEQARMENPDKWLMAFGHP